jgi:hypothetical protein
LLIDHVGPHSNIIKFGNVGSFGSASLESINVGMLLQKLKEDKVKNKMKKMRK